MVAGVTMGAQKGSYQQTVAEHYYPDCTGRYMETIPNVIMEALSHRMPVVATNVCGISEVIRDGETGLLVPQRDPRALALAVRRMLEDRERALGMAEAGRALVEQMFDRDTNITALRDLYLSADRSRRTEQG